MIETRLYRRTVAAVRAVLEQAHIRIACRDIGCPVMRAVIDDNDLQPVDADLSKRTSHRLDTLDNRCDSVFFVERGNHYGQCGPGGLDSRRRISPGRGWRRSVGNHCGILLTTPQRQGFPASCLSRLWIAESISYWRARHAGSAEN